MKTETLETQKAKLLVAIDYLEKEQIDTLLFIINIANRPFNKHTMVEFIRTANLVSRPYDDKETLENYDTAYPINYFREIENHYPEAANGNYVFDYSNNRSLGRLVNLNNLLVQAIIKKMA